uniref:YdbS-like PH domain-containing protein n=1 Tax=Leersia perrieri TaxID=77586 RepID=A0A0D9VQ13_9ORYZ
MPSPPSAAAAAATAAFLRPSPIPPPSTIPTPFRRLSLSPPPPRHLRLAVTPARAAAADGGGGGAETVYFDGGAHYGDLAANLVLGLTLLWLPLTLAAVSRAFILRYRFTSRRVTVISGLAGADRTDFPYSSVTSVVVVPRFIGEWGDIVITLKDGTKVDLRSVPRFREVAQYCKSMAAAEGSLVTASAAAAGEP